MQGAEETTLPVGATLVLPGAPRPAETLSVDPATGLCGRRPPGGCRAVLEEAADGIPSCS